MSERRRFPVRTAIISAIAAFSVLAGTIGSYAYWSATAQANLGVGAATLSTTATTWTTATLGNESVSTAGAISLTSSTASVTITNTTSTTSAQSPTLTATFSRQSGSTTLAAGTTLTVWPVASAAACTAAAVPSGQTSGTWSAGVVVSTPLAAGASQVYCLRNQVADRQAVDDVTGTLSFVPQVAAQLGIGTFTGGATVAGGALSTQYIYPLQTISAGVWNYVKRATTEWCWDINGGSTTSGTTVIAYGCKNNGDLNQDFRFMDGDGDGYGDFQPGSTSALRVATPASAASGSAVTVQTASTGSATQQWQPQLVSSGVYQFVNRYSGLCLSLPAVSAGAATVVTCTGGADQRFTLTTRSVVQLLAFTCTDVGGTGSGRSVQYTWSSDYAVGTLTFQAKHWSTGTWTTLGTTSGTTFAFASPVGSPFTGSTGTYNVRVLTAANDVVATDDITVSNSMFGFGYNFARC